MRKISLTLALAGLFTYACNIIEDCEMCTSPPPSINIALIDAETGQNLFAQKRVRTGDVSIYYLEGQSKTNISMTFMAWGGNGDTIIMADELSWESVSKHRFYLALNGNDTDTIDIKTKSMKDDCCSYYLQEYFDFNDTPAKDSILFRGDGLGLPVNVFFKK